ncbi:MAG TPA: PD-(D/E)XK nuclease family protein [Planctomycetaceae bacterium]|nr:PD-(D/E)XK nuclease family protein [Planctomycetaceae bacterium]
MAITRYFLDWNKPALPAAADYLINRYASGDQLDLSNVILVFPGRRAARRMLELLVQRGGPKWPAMRPPRMVTFGQFPELLYLKQKEFADDLTQLLVWRKALYAVPVKEIGAALPNRPDENSVSSWVALCESLRGQHNELAADGKDFDDVYRKLVELGNLAEADRWKALRRIQAEYLVQMDDVQLWDRQEARLVAVQKKECHTNNDIILIGTEDMNQIIRQMLDQIADRVTALIHAPESEADSFDEYGCVLPEQWETRLLNIPLDSTRIADSPPQQAQLTMLELAGFDGRFRADDITIGVADDSMVPTLTQAMADAGIAGQWPIGMSIRDSRPFQLLSAMALHVASAHDDLPPDFATLTDFIRHPDVYDWICQHLEQNLSDNDAIARRKNWLNALDEYVAEHLQITPGVMLGRAPRRIIVAEVCRAVEFLLRCLIPDAVEADDARSAVGRPGPGIHRGKKFRQRTLDDLEGQVESSLTQQLEKRRSLSEWADGAVRILATIYRDRDLRSDSEADRGIVACVTWLQALNEQLRRIPSSVLPKCTASQALQLLLRQAGEAAIPPEVNDQAVELLGWLELPLDDSPVLVLTGFNEGKIPESINSDAFMPNSLRTLLELTDNRRRYARDAYVLTSMMHSRRKLILIAGRTDVKGNPLAPSRLWFAAETKSLPERVRRFYSPEESNEVHGVVPEPAEPEAAPPRQSGFLVPPPLSVPPAPEEIPVTSFRDYLYCPYRYFLSRELRLRSVEDDVRELDAPAFGSLIHEVLKRFGQSDFRDAHSDEAIETFLLQELHQEALGRFGRTRSATVSVQLKMIESRLSAFARWQAKNCQDGWRIYQTEKKYECADFSDIHGRPVKLVGRVDRIDKHAQTGQYRVLDYKTSEAADKPEKTHRKKDEWIDLQLPLYRLLVRSEGITSNVELGYVQLPGDLAKIGAAIADWSEADLMNAENLARSIAADIIDLKITEVVPSGDHRSSEFTRICQDTVIDRNIPWLKSWAGRTVTEPTPCES